YALVVVGLPYSAARILIIAVTIAELYLGTVLALRTDLKLAMMCATGLLLAYTAFLWYLSTLAHPPSCGCLGLTGLFKSNKQAAVLGLGRNCLLLWMLRASYSYYFPAGRQNAPSATASASAPCTEKAGI